jgi:hypothetical protein
MARLVTSASKPRSLWILAWATIPVFCLAGYVQVTGSGIDLLVFATACFILLALERTVGDWLGELLGAALAGFLFAVCVAGTIYYFFSENAGRSHTDSFFLAAEKRGYRTLYYLPALPDGTRGHYSPVPEPPQDVVAAPVATNGGGTNGEPMGLPAPADPGPGSPPVSSLSPSEIVWRKTRPFWSWFFPESTVPVPTVVVLDVEPRIVRAPLRTVFRAAVTVGRKPVVNGSIEFSVNGGGAGRIILDAHGLASTHYSTYIAGTYSVTARYTGNAEYAASLSKPVTFIVER